MIQHDSFVDLKRPGKVCKVKRSIYGLNQIYRSWNIKFDGEIRKFYVKFKRNLCL
jgi:hypothetical protein